MALIESSPMLPQAATYDDLYKNFRWDIPARFNIATACCDRYADGSGRLALIYVDEDGGAQKLSFDEISALSKSFANVLKADGLVRGDRVAVFLSQSVELPIAHLAAFRSGMISVPLFTLFGEDALEYRLSNSGAKAVITDEGGWEKLSKIRDRLPHLQDIYITSGTDHAGRNRSGSRSKEPKISRPPTPARTIRRSSSTRRAPPEIPKARSMRIACCSAICRTSKWRMTSCPSPAI